MYLPRYTYVQNGGNICERTESTALDQFAKLPSGHIGDIIAYLAQESGYLVFILRLLNLILKSKYSTHSHT